ncbi:MAG: fumarate hydratase [Endomicrobium sp.]|jgi:fumarate hydratase subunit alpha|nr:fumarate hydratase [Endomicrobium sp.]
MKEINSTAITDAVIKLCAQANYELPEDVLNAVRTAYDKEQEPAKSVLSEIIENAELAAKEQIPLCQDTGTANFFIKLGADVKISGIPLIKAVNKGVSQSYKENYLRKSIVNDPLERKNTQDNTPANIYVEETEGGKIEITFLPKGGGSENASMLAMLAPAAGWQGVKDFVIQVIKQKGANACPPLIVGVGIGGDFSTVAKIAKQTLIRQIGSKNTDVHYNEKEEELLKEINALGIGAMGLGGKTTALAVFIDAKPAHIASLPVAVSIQCHSCRRQTIIL